MQEQQKSTKNATKKFRSSDVNGLLLAATVLAGTIVMAGATEARLQKAAAELAQSSASVSVAHCPYGYNYSGSVVR